ncbi:hypothetical protein E2C01_088224 [Portunus trituberculatus]|uniref:Uncharacterized protein n=1 Tax=Portunus trituberculatus TaxID=210409 RepID=A0A5B7JLC3_PORTR|nr:hypothetical protein [Portunus trituberculatus]
MELCTSQVEDSLPLLTLHVWRRPCVPYLARQSHTSSYQFFRALSRNSLNETTDVDPSLFLTDLNFSSHSTLKRFKEKKEEKTNKQTRLAS